MKQPSQAETRLPAAGPGGANGQHSRYASLGAWRWPLFAWNALLVVLILVGFIGSILQATKLLSPLPNEFMPMVFAFGLAGAAIGTAPLVLVLRLGGSGQIVWRNGMIALGAIPASMFVTYHFATRLVDYDIFRHGAERTFEADCRVSSFGGRSSNNAHIDCFGMGGIDLEITPSEYERLNAARDQRADGSDLGLCYRMTFQTVGRNLRLVLPSLLTEKRPHLMRCEEKK